MKKLIFCKSEVTKNAISSETVDGVEHIALTSYTLPDNIVMNGGLYPASEIASSFHTLERTLAPLGHPTDSDGNFLSASDPIAINNFYVGAYNAEVVQEGGRVRIKKLININEAEKTERGQRLLARINDLENGGEPIHTSVGVFLDVNYLGETKTNANGQAYDWVARSMVFDHDAILLDELGAAQPSQGVGIFANAQIEEFTLNTTESAQAETTAQAEQPQPKEDAMKEQIVNALQSEGVKTEGLSDVELLDAYSKLHANADEVETLKGRIAELEEKAEAEKQAKINALVEKITASEKYKGLEAEDLKSADMSLLEKMAANSADSV